MSRGMSWNTFIGMWITLMTPLVMIHLMGDKPSFKVAVIGAAIYGWSRLIGTLEQKR